MLTSWIPVSKNFKLNFYKWRILATLSKILTEEGLFQFDACTLFVHHTFLHFMHLGVPFLSFLNCAEKNRNSFSLEKCFVKSICSIFSEKVYFTEFFLELEEPSSLFYSPCTINLYQSKCWHCLLRKSETLKNPLHLLWVKKWSLDADKNDKLLPTWYFPWGKNKNS